MTDDSQAQTWTSNSDCWLGGAMWGGERDVKIRGFWWGDKNERGGERKSASFHLREWFA